MRDVSYYVRVVILGLFVFLTDLITKALVSEHIPLMGPSLLGYPYGGIGVFQNFFGIDFSINHYTNKGAAWGAFSDFQMPLLVLRIAVITAMTIYLLFFNKHLSWAMPLTLIIAGALGNVVDYFIYGHVIDMFHFVFWGYSYPVFNVADSAIFIGIAWLFILSWCDKSCTKHHI